MLVNTPWSIVDSKSRDLPTATFNFNTVGSLFWFKTFVFPLQLLVDTRFLIGVPMKKNVVKPNCFRLTPRHVR